MPRLKDDVRNKTRLIGKVNGYWITLDNRTRDIPETGLVISGLAAVMIGIGIYCFCLFL
jgi:hypothetical protein